jgi:uncharacterized protein (DUF433 family)
MMAGTMQSRIGHVMATASKMVYAHITKDPKVCGGKACLDDTRIRVMDIVELARQGKKPEEMLHVFAVPLTLAQVHAALAYYYDHQEEIERSVAEDDRWEEEHERGKSGHLGRRPAK